MNTNEVRKIFLDYFKDNHHTYVPGCNVIPENLKNILNGDIIFKLNTGAGLPLYIIEIICKEHNINIDYDNYYKLLKKHKT